jgi:ATP-dependent Clp protease ATP-binding subunit ClpA
MSVLEWQQRLSVAMAALKQQPYFGGIGRDWASGYTPLLSRFAQNLRLEVETGRYRHIPTVHEGLIDRMVQLLSENRPIALVGGVGVGKTELVYGLTQRLLEAKTAGSLAYYQVMELSASILISAGGSIEELMLQLLTEGVQARNTILFFDDAQLFFNNGPGAVDITQILLPILQRRALKIVLAMTEHDWQFLTAHQPAFAGALQRLIVNEPSAAETLKVVQDAAIGIEHQAGTVVMQEAITESIRLAGRYLSEASFPGKAITVLESAAHYAAGGFVTVASVQQAIESTTGAKVVAVSQPERQQLLDLEAQIHQRMVNQSRAVKVVADALRRARAGVSNPKRPVGSFLFLGPTGVGKTELAKALAAIYYGGVDAIVRIDMSEYQQQSDVTRLLSPSSGKQAGVTLVSGVRQRPSTVVLLDEVEKAHPDILNLLLQLLDEGRLTDTDGRVVSFSDAIVIATSNASADEIRQRIAAGEQLEAFETEITEHLIDSHQFKPELLNRFDEIVVFRPLTEQELTSVVGLMLAEVNAALGTQAITVALTEAAVSWLAKTGYDPKLGARPLRRLVQRSVENVVAERILAGSVVAGQTVTLDVSDLQPPAK